MKRIRVERLATTEVLLVGFVVSVVAIVDLRFRFLADFEGYKKSNLATMTLGAPLLSRSERFVDWYTAYAANNISERNEAAVTVVETPVMQEGRLSALQTAGDTYRLTGVFKRETESGSVDIVAVLIADEGGDIAARLGDAIGEFELEGIEDKSVRLVDADNNRIELMLFEDSNNE